MSSTFLHVLVYYAVVSGGNACNGMVVERTIAASGELAKDRIIHKHRISINASVSR